MMKLEELLGRFICEADINIIDPDAPNAVTYIAGEGARIPKRLRERKVMRFEISVETLDKQDFAPLLVVYLKSDETRRRRCTICGAEMREGYCYEGGLAYYCSTECLHKHFTDEEWDALYDENGDSYWTTWEEE